MRLLSIFLLLLSVFACKEKQAESNATTPSEVQSYSIAQFMDNEAVRGGSLSFDNSKVLISSNRTGIFNLYTIPATGGNYTPITASDSTSIYSISFFPNDDRLLFSADGNGDEINHIYLRDTTGVITDLTPEKGAKSTFYRWAKDQQSFFLVLIKETRNTSIYMN